MNAANPPPGFPDPLAPPVPLNVGLAPPRTYAEYYAQEAAVQPVDTLAPYMALFQADAPMAHQLLLDRVTGNVTTPQAYLAIYTTDTPRVYCLHRPSRFVPAIMGPASPWDNASFAFLGDVTEGIMTSVYFPTDAFTLTPDTDVYSAQESFNHLQANPQLTQLNIQQGTGTILRTRRLMALPIKYAPMFLDAAGIPLATAWLMLYPHLIQDNLLISCAPLVNWFRVALMRQRWILHGVPVVNAGQQPIFTACQSYRYLNAPGADPPLVRHRLTLLRQDIPALLQPTIIADAPGLAAGTNAALVTMANAIMRTTDAQLARQNDAALTSTPAGKWKDLLPSLLLASNVLSEADLTPFWHVMARTPKQHGMAVMRDALLAYSQSPHRFNFACPVVSGSLYLEVTSLKFCGETADDFSVGLSPFAVSDGSDAHRAANLQIAEIHSALLEGNTNISFRDMELIGTKLKLSVPSSFIDLINCLGIFGNLLGTIFGDIHPLVQAYRSFHTTLTTLMYREVQQLVDVRRLIQPVHILRRVQLECYAFFNAARTRNAPGVPKFDLILDDITRQIFQYPFLPAALEQMIPALSLPEFPTVHLANIPGLASLSDNSSSTGTTLSTLSGTTPYALTGGGGLPGGGTPRGGTPAGGTPGGGSGRSRILNPNMNQAVAKLLPSGMAIKAFIGQDSPPNNDQGSPMCLSFHLREGCWSNCRRITDHRPQSAGERARLTTFLRTKAPPQPGPAVPVPTPAPAATPGVPP